MKGFKPYGNYKSSGISWLGEIPEHWEVKRIKYIFTEQDKRSEDGLEELLSVSHYTGVTKKSDKYKAGEEISNAKTLVGYKVVTEGDLVMNIMLAWNGSLGISKYNGITSPAYCVFRSLIGGERYFGYLFRTKNAQQEFKKQSTGIIESRLRLYPDKFFNIKTAIPSAEEQITIANFLDYKISKIDRFIRKKKQLIKLLNEQKAAIINQAVTKGLDPNVKMKPSGIEWLGDIPEHWEVRKLKYVSKVKTGKTPKIESSLVDFFENGTVDWFTPGDFGNEGILSDSNRKINELAINDSQISLFPEKTVFMVGIGGTIGKIGICFDESSCNQQINALIFNNLIEPLYAYYFLKTQKHQIDLLADFTTLPILNQSKTKDIIFVYPKKDEQQQIVSHIEKETTIIKTTISKIEKELALTEEYKTALIAEAVTGKIDVRNFVAPETFEEETFEDLEVDLVAEDEGEYENEELEE
jgi:type I restriction enzyme, S subunit